MSKRYALKAINDEQDICSVCGKTNLKRVAWLAELDADGNAGEVVAVGLDCAGRMLSWSDGKTRKQIGILNDFQKIVEKAKKFTISHGKEKTLDWLTRLWWGFATKEFSLESMVLATDVEGVKVIAKIW